MFFNCGSIDRNSKFVLVQTHLISSVGDFKKVSVGTEEHVSSFKHLIKAANKCMTTCGKQDERAIVDMIHDVRSAACRMESVIFRTYGKNRTFNAGPVSLWRFELSRDCRSLVGLSYAAMASVSRAE